MSKQVQHQGATAEYLAVNYLKKQGCLVLQKNFFCRYGEIDIIIIDDSILTFVEVRCRKAKSMCHALESITPAKVSRIKTTAAVFLAKNKQLAHYMCRFDAMSVIKQENIYNISWMKNAFY